MNLKNMSRSKSQEIFFCLIKLLLFSIKLLYIYNIENYSRIGTVGTPVPVFPVFEVDKLYWISMGIHPLKHPPVINLQIIVNATTGKRNT